MPILIICFRCLVALLACAALFSATGCTVGPRLLHGSRNKYNAAVQTTASEEMLLNLVRVRYGDPPEFLAVSGITSQFEVNGGISIGTEFGLGDGRLGGNLNSADRPTVTLTPLQDEQFTRRFLSPIRPDTIHLFCRNGQNVERSVRLIVAGVNGVTNNPESESGSQTFDWLARTLGELARRQQVEFAYEETIDRLSHPLSQDRVQGADVVAAAEKGFEFQRANQDQSVILTRKSQALVLRVAPEVLGSPEVEGIVQILRLKPGQLVYPIQQAIEGQLEDRGDERGELLVSTRSVEEVLHFASFGVSVPDSHWEQGLVAGGGESANDLLLVQWCKHCPSHASVAVPYRGYWFYIDDADSQSKETFELLLELYNLEIRGGGAAGLPVLTLPVGR